jgi:hypothetical protein
VETPAALKKNLPRVFKPLPVFLTSHESPFTMVETNLVRPTFRATNPSPAPTAGSIPVKTATNPFKALLTIPIFDA